MAEIIHRGDSYLIRTSNGYYASGKQKRPSMTWRPEPGMTESQIKNEVNRQAVLFDESVKTGKQLSGNMKFEIYAISIWTPIAKQELSPKTFEGYKHMLKRLIVAFGQLRMDKIRPHHLIEFYKNLGETGIRSMRYKATNRLMQRFIKDEIPALTIAKQAKVAEMTVFAAVKGKNVSEKTARAVANVMKIKFVDAFHPVDADAVLSGSSLLHYHRLVSTMLTTAVHLQIIPSNPATNVKAPRKSQKESRYLDDEQAKVLIEKLQSEPVMQRAMITMLMYTGMRRGEMCGLKWSDIDYNKRIIQIKRSLQYLPDRGLFEKEPKNSSSKRAIKVPQITIGLLRELEAWIEAEKTAQGDQWLGCDYVFLSQHGGPMRPDYVTRWFSEFVKKNDLPNVSVHSLRHTNASLMIASGTDLRTVSKRLGHAQTSTTTNIYAHAIRSADEAASETLENILDPVPKKPIKLRKAAGQLTILAGNIIPIRHKQGTVPSI